MTIIELRQRTGLPLWECIEAYDKSEGDFDKALDLLKDKKRIDNVKKEKNQVIK